MSRSAVRLTAEHAQTAETGLLSVSLFTSLINSPSGLTWNLFKLNIFLSLHRGDDGIMPEMIKLEI